MGQAKHSSEKGTRGAPPVPRPFHTSVFVLVTKTICRQILIHYLLYGDSLLTGDAHDIGDVGGEHEIRLGIRHHGRVTTHGDYQKINFSKYFPAIYFL